MHALFNLLTSPKIAFEGTSQFIGYIAVFNVINSVGKINHVHKVNNQ